MTQHDSLVCVSNDFFCLFSQGKVLFKEEEVALKLLWTRLEILYLNMYESKKKRKKKEEAKFNLDRNATTHYFNLTLWKQNWLFPNIAFTAKQRSKFGRPRKKFFVKKKKKKRKKPKCLVSRGREKVAGRMCRVMKWACQCV